MPRLPPTLRLFLSQRFQFRLWLLLTCASGFFLLFGLLLRLLLYGEAVDTPVVDLGYAKYQGIYDSFDDITTFHGIRYAAAPVGTARFKAPQPPAHTLEVQVANQQSSACFGGYTGQALPVPQSLQKRAFPSEDCLFLNVFIPGSVQADAQLPVVVWIHGGGYIAGSTSGVDGGALIEHANGGVIVVAIQYRLGLFGFLAGAEMKMRGALNAGLLDQEFALQWVQEHIAAFGGDPAKVTIWGQSAGAGSVLQHVVAHGGATHPPLFRAAITSSAFLPPQHAFDAPAPERIYRAVAQQAGCAPARDTFACLQAADAAVLAAANAHITLSVLFGTFAFAPVVDGALIAARPAETLRTGTVNGDVLFAMTNTFEGRMFVHPRLADRPLAAYAAALFPALSAAQAAAVARAYAGAGRTALDRAGALMGEATFICPTYLLLAAFPGRSYKGEFAVLPADHGDDSAYLFRGHPASSDAAFRAAFAQPFLTVATALDPNAARRPGSPTPRWRAWSARRAEVRFNRTEAGQPDIRAVATDAGLLERCSLWASLAAVVPQ